MELYDYFRLCEDVPTEEEMDLAEEMREEFEADEAVAALDREEVAK